MLTNEKQAASVANAFQRINLSEGKNTNETSSKRG